MEVDEVEIDISTISDEDILADVQHRKLGLKVLQQYDFMADMPAIPDPKSPKVLTFKGVPGPV